MKRLTVLLLGGLAACSSTPSRVQDAERAKEYAAEGDAAYKAGKYEAAIERYTRAVELNPEHADAYHGRGCSWRQIAADRESKVRRDDALDSAWRDFTFALNRNPMHYDAHFNRGCILMALARPKEAAADFLRCTLIRTKDPEPHLLVGRIYQKYFENMQMQTLEHFEKYVENGGNDPDIVEQVKQFRELKKAMQPSPAAKPPTAEEEKKAEEMHRRALALVGENKRAEAVATLDELLRTLGHTKYVKQNGALLQKMRDAIAPK